MSKDTHSHILSLYNVWVCCRTKLRVPSKWEKPSSYLICSSKILSHRVSQYIDCQLHKQIGKHTLAHLQSVVHEYIAERFDSITCDKKREIFWLTMDHKGYASAPTNAEGTLPVAAAYHQPMQSAYPHPQPPPAYTTNPPPYQDAPLGTSMPYHPPPTQHQVPTVVHSKYGAD